MHEIIHWAGTAQNWAGVSTRFEYRSYYSDEVMAAAWHKLGVVMSVDQYRRTYPEHSERARKTFGGSDFANSYLAGNASRMSCLGVKNRLSPEFAKP